MNLLVLDIDDTILPRGELIIHKPVIEAINSCLKNGDAICLASGRPFPGIKQYLDAFSEGLKFAIVSNGAALYTNNQKLIVEKYLHPRDVYYLYNKYKSTHTSIYAYDDDSGLIIFNEDKWTKLELKVNHFDKVYNFNENDYSQSAIKIYKVMIADEEKYSKNFSLTEEDKKRFSASRSTVNYYEVLTIDSGKLERIKDLIKYLKLDAKNVYTFGDNNNDLMMIKDYYGIALGNALKECKDVAKFITLDVKDDGVAYAINKLILKK